MSEPALSTLELPAWQPGLARWPGAGRPLLALHGFTGSGEDFAPLAACLSRPLWAPDLPGHGRSRADDAASSIPAAVAGLLALLDALAPAQKPALLGYSLGGRLALNLALAAPERFAALVLVGTTPGIADAAERAQRREEDLALAARIEREGVEAFQAWWAQRPLIATQQRIAAPALAAMRRRRQSNRAQGLAAALRGLGTGVMAPRWAELTRLELPTLLITGAEDAKFTAIADRMEALLPGAASARIEGAGHCAHLERPAATADAIEAFLQQVGS